MSRVFPQPVSFRVIFAASTSTAAAVLRCSRRPFHPGYTAFDCSPLTNARQWGRRIVYWCTDLNNQFQFTKHRFYRASACLRMHSAILLWQICLSVRPSVRHILVLYRNDCTYRQTLSTFWQGNNSSFLSATAVTKFKRELLPSLNTQGEKNSDFRQKSSFISEMVRDRSMVTTEH